MGLFDHLFKTKTPTGGEKVGEHAPEGNAAKPIEAAPKTPVPQKEKADPSAFLHPKSFVPRGAPSVTPAPRPTVSAVTSKPAERRPVVSGPPPAADEIVLTLGDVLSRIPAPYLKSGTHDAKRELRFKINDLSSDIARGRAAVPLSRIAQLVPDIFTKEIGREEETEIRLPLQKLVEQIGLLRSRPKASVAEKIARSVSAVELPPGTKPIVPIEVKKEPLSAASTGPVPAAKTAVLEPLTPAATLPPQTPPIILSEPVLAPKTVELKATAEPNSAAASVILGPPPTGETPAAAAASNASVAPAPSVSPVVPVPPMAAAPVSAATVPPASETAAPLQVPAPVPPVVEVPAPAPIPAPAAVALVPETPVLEAEFAAESVKLQSALEPEAIEPISLVPPAEPAAPQKIVIDWGTGLSSKEEENKQPEEALIHDVVAEAKRIQAAAAAAAAEAVPASPALAPATASEESKLAAVDSPDLEAGEEKIHLSLAAILRQCPREILVGEMPQVDDSVRITLPFAPIDRQLVKGHVEVSALRFIIALPEVYRKFFVAKVGMKVPIPLEEVFQNLPAPKQELTPQPPTPPPVVLAPAVPTPAPEIAPAAENPVHLSKGATPVIEPVVAEPAVDEVKSTEPVSTPVEPPSLPVFAPVDVSRSKAPAATEGAERVLPASAEPIELSTKLPHPVIPPIFDMPEAAIVEKLAQPPLETAAGVVEPPIPSISVAASATEAAQGAPSGFVPPWLSVEPAPVAAQEAPQEETPAAPIVPPEEIPAAPVIAVNEVPPISFAPIAQEAPADGGATEAVPPTEPITSSEVNAAPSEDAPLLKLQRPFFRPHFVPPPIFGFAPPPASPEPEPVVSKPEPPSVLAGLTEAAARETATEPASEATSPVAETPISEVRAEASVIFEPITPRDEAPPVSAPQVDVALEPAVAVVASAEPIEVTSASASESEPTVEMIALAGEHEAPDIAHFSDEPIPFADLAETYAHETTYAPDLAEAFHADLPTPEPAHPTTPVRAESAPAVETPVEATKVEEAEGHRAVPIVEGLATAAVAATIAEHVPLDFREVVAPAEEPGAIEEATASVETPASEAEAKAEEPQPAAALVEEVEAPETAEESKDSAVVEEPVALDAVVEPTAVESSAEAATSAAKKVEKAPAAPVQDSETPAETPVSQPPATFAPEPPAAVAPPPPHPLFPLPKVHLEPAHVEVLPPPSLPLRRFDQDAVQALFMTEETLDLPKISRLAAALPGVYACVIATRDQACTGGNLPEGFDLAALLGLAPRVGEAAGRMPIGQLKHFTLYGDAYSVSFFERNGLSLCAVHRPRSFVPGVREKLVALADELSR